MPAAIAIPAIVGAVGAGTSLAGAAMGSRAAKSAANTQAGAAREAGQLTQAAGNAGASAIEGAIPTANGYVTDAAGQANDLLSQLYQRFSGDISPYQQAGTDALGRLSAESQNTPQFDPSQVSVDPGFQFRLQQGQKALERSAAARGGALGGGAAQALARYSQDYSSGEYQNAYSRALSGFNANLAGRQQGLNTLEALANYGQSANQQALSAGSMYGGLESGNLMDAGRFAGGNLMAGTQAAAGMRMQGAQGMSAGITGAGAAQAAGQMGSANAWSQGMGGTANAVMNAGMMYMLMNGKKAPTGGNV